MNKNYMRIKMILLSILHIHNLNIDQEEDLDDYLSSVDSNDKLEDIIDYCRNFNKDYELA